MRVANTADGAKQFRLFIPAPLMRRVRVAAAKYGCRGVNEYICGVLEANVPLVADEEPARKRTA